MSGCRLPLSADDRSDIGIGQRFADGRRSCTDRWCAGRRFVILAVSGQRQLFHRGRLVRPERWISPSSDSSDISVLPALDHTLGKRIRCRDLQSAAGVVAFWHSDVCHCRGASFLYEEKGGDR